MPRDPAQRKNADNRRRPGFDKLAQGLHFEGKSSTESYGPKKAGGLTPGHGAQLLAP